jgi:hypothetical protein
MLHGRTVPRLGRWALVGLLAAVALLAPGRSMAVGVRQPDWKTTYDGFSSPIDEATWVAVDDSGDVFAAGFVTGSGSGPDFFVVKLEGSTGNEIWRGTVDGTASDADEGVHLAIDGSGDVVVAGLLTNSGTDQDFAVLKFLPEPNQWLLLASGVLGLALLHRIAPRRGA